MNNITDLKNPSVMMLIMHSIFEIVGYAFFIILLDTIILKTNTANIDNVDTYVIILSISVGTFVTYVDIIIEIINNKSHTNIIQPYFSSPAILPKLTLL